MTGATHPAVHWRLRSRRRAARTPEVDGATRSRSAHPALEALLVVLLSLISAAWVLRLWNADLTVPLRYAPVDDTKFYLMLAKGILEHGTYLSNPHLGAPFGQRLSDYPQGGDNLSLLMIGAISLFTANAALVVNVFYLLTFALAAGTAHCVLRSLGVCRRAAGVCAVLFSLLAYHFFRGESHLLLSAYYAVPLAAYLFLKLIAGAPLFVRRNPTGVARWLSRRTLTSVAALAVIGSANLYYSTFAVAVLLGGCLLAAATGRRATALAGLALVALTAASIAVNLSPSLIYRAEHGANSALERSAAFTERSDEAFSLRLANLLLPAPDSRIAPLRSLARRYDDAIAPGYCESCYASLGTVGTIGFATLMLSALAALIGAGGTLLARPLLRHAALGALLALGLATVGGLASLVEVFLTPDLRAWNRISVFIAFLSLLAAAVLLEAVLIRMRTRRLGSAAGSVVLATVLLFGVYDQSGDSSVPAYAATAAEWRSDQHFVAAIERRLPVGAAVFQLPYVPFPEGYPETPVGDRYATYATKYEPLRGYLHASSLRWSYGAVKGRPDDWNAQLAGQPLSYVLAAAAAAGFDGLWVDPAGFEPAKTASMGTALRALLGARPLLSPAGDLWFFDLRPYLARLRRARAPAQLLLLRRETLAPLRVACAAGGLTVTNPYRTPLTATLRLTLPRAGGAYAPPGSVVPDGQAADIPADATVTLTRSVRLPPGARAIRLAALALPAGALPRVLLATVTDSSLVPFASSASEVANTLIPGLTGQHCG